MARLCASEGLRLAAATFWVVSQLVMADPRTVLGQPQDSFLYDRPVLTVDVGMHTVAVKSTASSRDGTFAVTGAEDKTIRVWSLANGELLQTIRVPAGPGEIGKIYAVAMTPDGDLIAAGGWTGEGEKHPVYLFDRASGQMVAQIPDLPSATLAIAFSPDARYLAVMISDYGLRVYDRQKGWAEEEPSATPLIRDTRMP